MNLVIPIVASENESPAPTLIGNVMRPELFPKVRLPNHHSAPMVLHRSREYFGA